MATNIIEITGMAELTGKLRNPGLVNEPFKRMLTDMSKIAQKTAREQAPHHIKITRRTTQLMARVRAVGPDAATWEIGRKPGAKMPPTRGPKAAGFLNWMTSRGIDPRLKFVIARSIARRGLQGRFYMRHAHDVTEAALPARLQVMGNEIKATWNA